MADIDEVEERTLNLLQSHLSSYLSDIATSRGDSKTPTIIRQFMDSISPPNSFPAVAVSIGQKQIQYEQTRFPEKFPLTIQVFDYGDDNVGVQRIGEAIESFMNDYNDLDGLVPGTKFNGSQQNNPLQTPSPPMWGWQGSWVIYMQEAPTVAQTVFSIDASFTMKTLGEFIEMDSAVPESISNDAIFAVDSDNVKIGGGEMFISSTPESGQTPGGNAVAGIATSKHLFGNSITENCNEDHAGNPNIDHLIVIDNNGNIFLKYEYQFFRALGSDTILEISEEGDLMTMGRFYSSGLTTGNLAVVFYDNGDIAFQYEFSTISELKEA